MYFSSEKNLKGIFKYCNHQVLQLNFYVLLNIVTLRRPVSASVAQLSRRLLSTSDPRTSHWSRFSSPRSDIIATISTARSSQSARSGIMSSRSYCSPKVNSKNISTTRESLSSRIHSGQNSHRSQTRKEDAAAVRSLL